MIVICEGISDIAYPELVEVDITEDGRIWVNVDGVCRFRATRCKKIALVGLTGYYAGNKWKGVEKGKEKA